MAFDQLAPGDLVLASFPGNFPPGREQEGLRPAIVTCLPRGSRFAVAIVLPLTTNIGRWRDAAPRLYPTLGPGSANLTRTSAVLLDQIRSLDVRRLVRYLGTLEPAQYDGIKHGLAAMCGSDGGLVE